MLDLLFPKVKYEFFGFADIQQEVMFATPFYHAIILTDVILLVSVGYQANYGSVISIFYDVTVFVLRYQVGVQYKQYCRQDTSLR